MEPVGFARSRAFWQRFGWGSLMGLLGGVAAFLYAGTMHQGLHLLWPTEPSLAPFSGPIRIVVIMTLAGVVVGLIHKRLPTAEVDVFAAIPTGDMPLTHVTGAVLVSLASLIGGFSLGPEAPTGIVAGALAVWLSRRQKLPAAIRRTNLLSAVAGAFAGLFTAPFGVLLMGLELRHRQTGYYYGTLAIVAIASLLGFTVFYTVGGDRFSQSLRLLELPPYSLAQWHIPLAILLGLLAVPLALLFAQLLKTLHHLMAPLHHRPILRCGAVGLLLGLLAMAMPSTLFLGSAGLAAVVSDQAQLSIGFILVATLLKILATTTALAAGFIGGPIFPLFFVGGATGVVVAKLLPAIPVALAVASLMAAVPGAIVPFPITLGLIVLLVASVPVQNAIPVMTATLTAHLVFQGVVRRSPLPTDQQHRDIDAELQAQDVLLDPLPNEQP
ncbi:MAG: chloride channel protein [Leptolyngbyaceae cyanobacterium]